MNIEKPRTCRGFVLCAGSLGPGEQYTFTNTGDGDVNQIVYTLAGGGIDEQDGVVIHFNAGEITDVSSFANKPYLGTPGAEGVTWMCINPLPATKRYEHRLAPIGDSTFISNTPECHVICASETPIVCNGKTIQKFNYARILNGNTVNLNVPTGAAALIITA